MRPQERDIAPTTPLGERVSVQAYRYGAVRYGGEKEAEVEIERCKRASEYRQSRQGRGQSRALVRRRLASCMEAGNRAVHETVISVRR